MADDMVEVINPADFFRNESGEFETTSPWGHVFRVTVRPGSQMNIRQISEPKVIENPQHKIWTIRRMSNAAA